MKIKEFGPRGTHKDPPLYLVGQEGLPASTFGEIYFSRYNIL